jgi:hypothetical protein
VVIYNLIEVYGVSIIGIAGLAVSLLGVIISFIYAHMKSGLWRLVHARTSNLDEREISVTRGALGRSYSWFSVICLVTFYWELLVIKGSIGALEIACLIYLAHTLPSSFIGWSEREV